MMVGMLGIFFELSNPGVILPGVLGGISLILAFFAFQSLPINWAGLLLILFGLALLVAEIKIVSHGILTIGGVVSMVRGSMMLYDAPETGLRISWLVIIPTVGAMAGLVIAAVAMGLRAPYRPACPAAGTRGLRALCRPGSTGAAGMMGQVGVVKRALDPEGQVLIDGELWQAVAEDGPVAAGEVVRVARMDGLRLTVTRSARRA